VNLKYGLVALVGLGLSANVSATDLTCNDIQFTPEAYAAYEFVDKACLDMVDRNGTAYAKLTATIVSQVGVSTYVKFKHSDGMEGPRHKSALAKNFETMIGGKPVMLKDLPEGQEVNVYVGNEYWASLAMVEEAIAEEVVEEMVEEAVMEEVIEEEIESTLPTTAGPLPWLALFGSFFLILGGALRFSRKQ
jgi:hypothetical protein